MPDIDIIKAPPQDLAAEQAVLGAIFLDSDRLIEVKEFLSTDDFTKTHTRLFSEPWNTCQTIVKRLMC